MADEEDEKDDYFLEMSHCGLKVTGQGSYDDFPSNQGKSAAWPVSSY